MDLAELTALTEDQAREYIEHIRWPHGPVCPHCGRTKVGTIMANLESSVRAGLYTCLSCMKQFTVTVDTVMHGSHIPLRQCLIAFHLMMSSKKGISALQLQRNLGLGSYRSAWYLAHRIRYVMKHGSMFLPLKGAVEVDETYVGGRPRKDSQGNPDPHNKRGRGTKKTPVLALVERNGNVVSKPIEHVDAKTLKGAIKGMVHRESTIMTDDRCLLMDKPSKKKQLKKLSFYGYTLEEIVRAVVQTDPKAMWEEEKQEKERRRAQKSEVGSPNGEVANK